MNAKQEKNESMESFLGRVVVLREELAAAAHSMQDIDELMTVNARSVNDWT